MGVHKEGKLWRVQVQVKGRRTSTTARTAEEARAIESRIRRDNALSRAGLPPERSLEEALTRWLDEYVPNLKRQKDYESHIRALVPYCAGHFLEDLPEVWQAYRDGNKELTASTHNRRGAVLRRIAALAHRWGWCGPGIADKIDLLPENPARHIYLTPVELRRLVSACEFQPTKDMVMIVAHSGLRPSEVMALTKEDVSNGNLVVRQSKTGKPRMVPIHPNIREAVRRLPIPVGYRWIARYFEKARKTVGHPEWRIYDLRHTAASWLVQSGADLVTVRDILGHTSLAMTGRYAHLATEHLKAAIGRMGAPRVHRRKAG